MVLIFQILCKEQIANSQVVTVAKSYIPRFIVENADLIGFYDYNGNDQMRLSIILFAYVLNFVCAIITKRHLVNLYKQIKVLEESDGDYLK